MILAFIDDSVNNYNTWWQRQDRNGSEAWKEPLVKMVETAVSPQGPVLWSLSSPAPKSSGLGEGYHHPIETLVVAQAPQEAGAKGRGAGWRKPFPPSYKMVMYQEYIGRKISSSGHLQREERAGPRESAGCLWKSTSGSQLFPGLERMNERKAFHSCRNVQKSEFQDSEAETGYLILLARIHISLDG